MQHIILSLLLIINLSISLFASNITTQEHLVSLSPIEGADNARPKTLVQVTFDREIIESSVKRHTIQLKPLTPKAKKVSASITISDKSTLVFTPNELLKEGLYRVKINPIKLKADKEDSKALSFIKTKLIQYTFSVVDRPEILNIKLNTTLLELNEGETAQLNAVANYDDNTSKDITQEALWSVDNPSVATIDTNATINAIQEGSAQITASLENITSQTLSLSVRKVINGHTLPPMPDKTLNDSTLLGIDVNSNGVRDDVERWIYETYTEPVEIGLFMQSARAYQRVIVDPSKALETIVYIDNSYSCRKYILSNNILLYKKYEYKHVNKELKVIQFNSIQRHIAYQRFNAEFSGEVFSSPKASKEKCEFDENGIFSRSQVPLGNAPRRKCPWGAYISKHTK